MSSKLINRLEKLEVPKSGTAVVCSSVDAEGAEHFLWGVPCRNPSHQLNILIPPGGADPVFSIEDIDK